MIDIKAIKAAAEAATPGPWVQTNGVMWGADGTDVVASGYGVGHGAPDTTPGAGCKRKANGVFLRMIDSTTVITLYDEIERLRTKLEVTDKTGYDGIDWQGRQLHLQRLRHGGRCD